jgi:hypothetical protein
MTRPKKGWEQLHQATKARYRRGGRSEAEARHLYESGASPPPASKSKTERKAEVRGALARNEPTSSAPAEADQLWANRINEADAKMQSTMADMVNAIITVGKTLLAAKAELGHGNFQPMVEHKTRFKLRTAELYMQIASNAFLANPQHVASLPPYVGVLGVLASWKPAALEAAIAAGDVTPGLDRAKASELSREYGPPPKAISPQPAPQPAASPAPVGPVTPPRRGSGARSPVADARRPVLDRQAYIDRAARPAGRPGYQAWL